MTDNETAPPPKPIFILATKSFWLGLFPALITSLDIIIAWIGNGMTGPTAELLSWFLPWATSDIERVIVTLLPFWTAVVAYQRRGRNRPYTIKVSKETVK